VLLITEKFINDAIDRTRRIILPPIADRPRWFASTRPRPCLFYAGTNAENYLPYGAEYFGCRECHRLTYQSRRMHRDKIWEAYGKHREYIMRIEGNF
jgi:hypothetical protein